jgi:hypothetical protein
MEKLRRLVKRLREEWGRIALQHDFLSQRRWYSSILIETSSGLVSALFDVLTLSLPWRQIPVTFLFVAIEKGDGYFISLLCFKGVDICGREFEMTPLIYAVQLGERPEMIRFPDIPRIRLRGHRRKKEKQPYIKLWIAGTSLSWKLR